MVKKLYFYFKLMVLMLCSIVGVGFISGAEIYQFFVRFGRYSYFSILIFFLLIYFLVNKILKETEKNQKTSKMNILNKNELNNTFLIKYKVKSKLVFFNILMVSSAMFSGLFYIIKKLFYNNYLLCIILSLIIIFIVLYLGISGLQKFDYFVLILIVFIVCYFCFCGNFRIFEIGYVHYNINIKAIIFSCLFSCLYVFMNIVQIEPIINETKIKFSLKNRRCFSFVFAFVLTLLLFIFVKFFICNFYLKNSEMPFLKYFNFKGGAVYIIFIICLFTALFSSLISALIGVKNKLNKRLNSNLMASVGAIVLSCVLSLIGFSNFVSIVYPIIGVVNFIIYVFL